MSLHKTPMCRFILLINFILLSHVIITKKSQGSVGNGYFRASLYVTIYFSNNNLLHLYIFTTAVVALGHPWDSRITVPCGTPTEYPATLGPGVPDKISKIFFEILRNYNNVMYTALQLEFARWAFNM